MRLLYFFILTLLTVCSFKEYDARISSKDIKPLIGSLWMGKLTYLDYSSKKRVTIDANLLVTSSPGNSNEWYFSNRYPREPHANSIDTIVISEGGRSFDGRKVLSRFRIKGLLQIVTQQSHSSDGAEKDFRYTYLIGKKSFSIKKEEKGAKDSVFFERNTYSYSRP